MNEYNFKLIYPSDRPKISVDQLMRQLLIPRKWRHFLRTERKITINGKYLPLNFEIHPNDEICITLDQVFSQQSPYPASNHLPDIVYEDENVLVINKPAGQKTHPNLFETDTALNDCATYLHHSPYIVHRLDQQTSGLLLVAKNPAVVPILNRELTTKTFYRDYIAKVKSSSLIQKQGTISAPIGQDPDDQRKRKVDPNGLKAITHYQVIERDNKTTTLKVSLETGRTHQIRVHLAHLGAPILGDPLYNPDYIQDQKLALTAVHISFIKPFTFDRQEIFLEK